MGTCNCLGPQPGQPHCPCVMRTLERYRKTLDLQTPTLAFEGGLVTAWSFIRRFSETDWQDDPSELRRRLDDFVEEARDLITFGRSDKSPSLRAHPTGEASGE